MRSWFFIIFLALMVAMPIKFWWYLSTSEAVYEATITDKVVKQYKDGSKYLIFTDKGTYENTDTWMALKFNSSDVYGQAKIGAVCDLYVYGWRIPFFSMYQNIKSMNCKS